MWVLITRMLRSSMRRLRVFRTGFVRFRCGGVWRRGGGDAARSSMRSWWIRLWVPVSDGWGPVWRAVGKRWWVWCC